MIFAKRNFKTLLSLILGPYLPFLVGLTREDVRRLFPFFEKNVWEMLRESGYLHIQATKPDTAGGDTHKSRRNKVKVDLSVFYNPAHVACAGRGLNDSPVGLGAYILEKFSTWTDMKNRDLDDGGLERYNACDFISNFFFFF